MRKNNVLKIVVVGFLVLAMVATSLLPAFAASSPTHGKVVKTYAKKLVKDAKSKNRYAIYKKGTAHLKSLRVGKKKTATVPTTMTYKDVIYKVTCIRGNAFTKSKKLKHLKIRKNITSINKNAFKGSSITKITFTDKKIDKLKKGAEIAGGVILILIGLKTIIEYLFF